MDEKAEAERRKVITRNKEWKSATAVRRDFVTQLLTRKTPPKGSASYVAVELALGSHPLRRALERAHQLTATLLGVDDSHARQAITDQASTAADARAQVITLGLVLGAIEESTDVHTWREPSEVIRRYFAFLAANGYALSEVEQIAAGTHKANPPAHLLNRACRRHRPVGPVPASRSRLTRPARPVAACTHPRARRHLCPDMEPPAGAPTPRRGLDQPPDSQEASPHVEATRPPTPPTPRSTPRPARAAPPRPPRPVRAAEIRRGIPDPAMALRT